jgi:hypothetical protein
MLQRKSVCSVFFSPAERLLNGSVYTSVRSSESANKQKTKERIFMKTDVGRFTKKFRRISVLIKIGQK